MSRYRVAFQFFRHRVRSKRWDSFHSPYLFSLFSFCCDKKITSPLFAEIEKQREKLRTSGLTIQRKDFGAGSTLSKTSDAQNISSIAKNALSLPFQCRFLFRLVQFTKPGTVLEFGTSLGISASYLAAGKEDTRVITIEGDAAIAEIALSVFENLKLKNIELICSTFENFIQTSLTNLPALDLIFLDGHHVSNALLQYYKELRPTFHANTIVVVDDIYWSKDMNDGWNQLIEKTEVTQSVDCFHFGLLFFRQDFLNKENHLIRLPY